MKLKIKLLPLLAFLLFSCGVRDNNSLSEISYDYSSIDSFLIEWDDLLSKDKELYFVYIFSKRCGHCNAIKNEIISFAIHRDDFFFIEYQESIPLINDKKAVVGANNMGELGIMGTPSLFEITYSTVTNYFVGVNEILETLSNL